MDIATQAAEGSSVISGIKRVWAILDRRNRLRVIWYLALSIANAMLELCGIGLILLLIQSLSGSQRPSWFANILEWVPNLGFGGRYAGEITIIIGMVLVYLLRFIVGVLYSYERMRVVTDLQLKLQARLFDALLHSRYEHHQHRDPATAINNLTITATRVASRFFVNILVIVVEGMLMLTLVGFLVLQQPMMTLTVALGLLGIYVAIHVLIQNKLTENGRIETILSRRYSRLILDTLSSFREIRTYGLERVLADKHDVELGKRYRQVETARRLREMPRLVVESGISILALCIILALLLADTPVETFTRNVTLFGIVVVRFLPSANRLAMAWNELTGSTHAVEAYDIMLRELRQGTEDNGEDGGDTLGFDNEIRFDRVSFRYQGGPTNSIASVSLAIPRGAVVGIIGRTGAGKSTLIELLIGLLRPADGRIAVDGVTLDRASARRWRKQIGYVPQQTVLTEATIADNIRFGREEGSGDRAKVEEAARRAHLDDFIPSLPAGLDTMVGDSGTQLSGGQRQRIGIARALYNRPSVLVLDEATSALDLLTEEAIVSSLADLKGKLTIIIVTHRLSALNGCDMVYLLERGAVAAFGSRETVSRIFRDQGASLGQAHVG